MGEFAIGRTCLAIVTGASVIACLGSVDARSTTPPRATINICDTAAHPDTVGVRARMSSPDPTLDLMMRFRVARTIGRGEPEWLPGGDSGWLKVGHGAFDKFEAGYSFIVTPPTAVRGHVDFRWVRRGTVIKSATRYTRTGFGKSKGSDPKGFSAARCKLVQP